jgi:general secretion pathway protein D
METFKPIISLRGRVALLATACFISPVVGGEPYRGATSADRISSKVFASLDEAQELLKKGDEAYTSARYADAVEAYQGAHELIPNAPTTAELKSAAAERYAQASVEQARYLSRKGDVAGAKAAVDKVLADSVAPKHIGATNFRAELDDPIRTNPALTPEHAKNVDSVRRLLYTAEGAYNLGKFDEAKSTYQDVLRIDSTNTAARRGLEQVAVARSNYHKASFDHARAEMLSDVDKAWELQTPPLEVEVPTGDLGGATSNGEITVRAKLDNIIIPRIALEQASLQEALDFLRVRATENDADEPDPSRKGVNITVNLGPPESPAATKVRETRFNLQLSQVPLSQALKQITELTGTSYTTDDYSVIISANAATSGEMISRSYKVPPDFISSVSTGSGGEKASSDPFATEPAAGLLPKRQTAKEVLENQGVTFPEGASASYIAANNTLRVVNTAENQDYISQLVSTVARSEPVTVSVSVTMIRVEQTRLEELGFDWLLDNFQFGGGPELNLSGGTQGNGGDLSDIALASTSAVATRNPITAGNRSGDTAILGNSIDEVLGTRSRGDFNDRAPGIFGLRGQLNKTALQTLMRGLDQKKGVDLMARPSITTRSGQTSSIEIVREFIYPTEYEPPELPQNTNAGTQLFVNGVNVNRNSQAVTPATPTAFEKKDVGVTLDVLPVVDANKQYVSLTLTPTFSDFDGFVNYGSPINATESGPLGPVEVVLTENAILQPVFSKQSVTTNVDIADGATVVIGGLEQQTVQNVEDQTPILGSIPVIGRLFQSKVRQPKAVNIIFLVNAKIQDPTGRSFNNR